MCSVLKKKAKEKRERKKEKIRKRKLKLPIYPPLLDYTMTHNLFLGNFDLSFNMNPPWSSGLFDLNT